MVSVATIQSKVWYGYGKAATVLGPTLSLYRAQAALTAPVVEANLVGPIAAQFTVANTAFNFLRAPKENEFVWFCLIDGSQVQVGDVLTDGTALTYYIAQMESLLPIVAVQCTNVVTIERPLSALAPTGGNVGYIGQVNSEISGNPIASSIPACIKANSIGNSRRGDGKIADDAPGPIRWDVYVPPAIVPQGSVLDRDIVADGVYRYQVVAAFWSQMGYKLECIRLEA